MSNLYRELPVQAFFAAGYDEFQIFLKHGKNYTEKLSLREKPSEL